MNFSWAWALGMHHSQPVTVNKIITKYIHQFFLIAN